MSVLRRFGSLISLRRRSISTHETSFSRNSTDIESPRSISTGTMTKEEKHRFLLFTSVLLKYLDRLDPGASSENETLTATLKARLCEVVPLGYWKRTEKYLNRCLRERQYRQFLSDPVQPPDEVLVDANQTDDDLESPRVAFGESINVCNISDPFRHVCANHDQF